MPVVLAPLIILADVLVTLAIAALAAYIIAGLFRLLESQLGNVPILGNFLRSAARTVAQELTNLLGTFERGIDTAIGSSWHLLAESADWVWRETKHQAGAILQSSILVSALAAAYALLHRELRDLTKGLNDLPHDVGKQLARLRVGIDRMSRELTTEQRYITRVVTPRLRVAEGEIGKIEDVVIPDIRGAIAGAETDIGALRKWITANIPIPGTIAFTGAIAVALGALGLGGLSCSNFKNLLSKFGCGLGTLLNDLLGLMIAGLFLESVCEFLPQFEAAFGAVVGPITELLTNTPLGNCENVPAGWAHLDVAAGPLPPAQTLGSFPS